MKKNKKIYEAPLLTVVEFRTEMGYASSGRFKPVEQINMFIDMELNNVGINSGTDGNLAAGYLSNEWGDHSGDVSGNWSYANGSWF